MKLPQIAGQREGWWLGEGGFERGAADEKSNFQFFYTKMPNMLGLRKAKE